MSFFVYPLHTVFDIFLVSIVKFQIFHNTFIACSLWISLCALFWQKRAISNSLTQIMTYEHKTHTILRIRLKAEQFINCSHSKIWFPSRPMENLAQPDQWKFYWNFNINGRWINSKQFQIFYIGNKYQTSIICLVSCHDISMLVRDDNPNDRTQKPRFSRFW